MNGGPLLKTEVLLDHCGSEDDVHLFAYTEEDEPPGIQVLMSEIHWQDLNRPTEITVRIKAGDWLNQEDPDAIQE